MQTESCRNITRYTYTRAAFQGWRVCISRNSKLFTRYISDKEYGSEESSFAVALELRNRILAEIQAAPGNIEAIFEKFRHYTPSATPLPQGAEGA